MAEHITQITEEVEKNSQVAAAYLDIRKAFDSVDHKILLRKLANCGIRGFMLAWFKSYLCGRKQRIKIGNIRSSWRDIKAGVPQGSVLGPILFLIYVNDLLKLTLHGTLYSFADDTALVCARRTGGELKRVLEEDLRKIVRWLWCHKLKLNISKSKCVYYAFKIGYEWRLPIIVHTCENEEVNCLCLPLERVSNYKYLGVVVNETLSWMDRCVLLGTMRSLHHLL